MRGVARPVGKLPASNQPPNVMLSKELVSPSDIKFVSLCPPLLLYTPSPPSQTACNLWIFFPLFSL